MADHSPLAVPLVLTMGEPAGIGPDVTLAAWLRREEFGLPPFFCLGDAAVLAERARQIGLQCPIEETTPEASVGLFGRALPVVQLDARIAAVAGKPDTANASAVIEAIARAVGCVREGEASAVVTNPIAKKTLYDAGFRHPGHTEFLGTLSAAWTGTAARPVMMLAGPNLRAVPVTIHIPLREVTGSLTEAAIVETGRIVAESLRRRFALPEPRLAVAGLNPHAGEHGHIGDEDETVVRPAVQALCGLGIDARGPLSADTMFHPEALTEYDAALCMYHDQALIPAKTLSFTETVNVTLGLPFVRTSPDHGTAFAIAGSGKADPTSLAAALRLAGTLWRNEQAQ